MKGLFLNTCDFRAYPLTPHVRFIIITGMETFLRSIYKNKSVSFGGVHRNNTVFNLSFNLLLMSVNKTYQKKNY